jgi:hypothetical protein
MTRRSSIRLSRMNTNKEDRGHDVDELDELEDRFILEILSFEKTMSRILVRLATQDRISIEDQDATPAKKSNY